MPKLRKKAAVGSLASALEAIPNIGPSVAQDLRRIGIKRPEQLVGRDPESLYQALCERTGSRQDPCVLDTFVSAVRFMEGAPARPRWYYTPEHKKPSQSLMKTDERIVCQTPTPGKTAKRIDAWKYDLVRKAILRILPRRGEGVLLADLPSLVEQRLSPSECERLGSVNWVHHHRQACTRSERRDSPRQRRRSAAAVAEIGHLYWDGTSAPVSYWLSTASARHRSASCSRKATSLRPARPVRSP